MPQSTDPTFTDQLDDRFTDLTYQVSGATARLYRATDQETQGVVAIKVAKSGTSDLRFAREIKILQKIRHPNIVRYVHHGTTPRGEPYLVLEWLEGRDLRSRLDQGPIEPKTALEIMRQAAKGLACLHDNGVLHRDLKPANIFLVSSSQEVRIIDLGLAQDASLTLITQDGSLLGTPAFMAPEQARGDGKVGPAADVYSLCAVYYLMISGRLPFEGDTIWSVLSQIAFEPLRPPSTHNPSLPPQHERLIMRGMSRDIGIRPQHASELVQLLEQLQGDDSLLEPDPTVSRRKASRRLVSALLCQPLRQMDSDPLGAGRFHTCMDRFNGEGLSLRGNGYIGVFGRQKSEGDEHLRCLYAARAAQSLAGDAYRFSVAMGKVREDVGSSEVVSQAARYLDAAPMSHDILVDPAIARRANPEFKFRREQGYYRLIPIEDMGSDREMPLFGRQSEFTMLKSMAERSIEESSPQTAVIIGETGIGKSRLAREMTRHSLQLGMRPFTVRLNSHMLHSPYALLKALLVSRAYSGSAQSLQEENRIVLSFLHQLPVQLPRLEQLFHDRTSIEIGEADLRRWRIWENAAKWVSYELDRGPMIWLLEDMQWADRVSSELVAWLIHQLMGRWFVMMTTRKRLKRNDLWDQVHPFTLELRSLRHQATMEMIGSLLPQERADRAAEIAEKSQGNPFYIEELCLREEAPAFDQGHSLTTNIQVLAQSKLDDLEPEVVEVARAAAVLGENGSYDAIRAVSRGHPQLASESLIRNRVWLPVWGPSNQRFQFRHGILREAIYSLISVEKRERMHRLAGAYFMGTDETNPATATDHFFLAGEDELALEALCCAAEDAHRAVDAELALDLVDRLLNLNPANEIQCIALTIRAEAKTWVGQLSAALADVNLLLKHPTASERQKASVACTGILILRRLSRTQSAARLAEIAMKHAGASEDKTLIARVAFTTTYVHYDLGDVDSVRECQHRLEALAKELPAARAQCYETTAMADAMAGDFEHGLWASLKALELNRAMENHVRIPANTANIGLKYMHLGLPSKAEPYFRDSRQLFLRQGNKLQAMDATMNLGRVLGLQGNYAESLDLLRTAEQAFKSAGETHYRQVVQAITARMHAYRGDRETAMALIKELDPDQSSFSHALEVWVAILEVHLAFSSGQTLLPWARRALDTVVHMRRQGHLYSSAWALVAASLISEEDESSRRAVAKAVEVVRLRVDLCRDGESRRGLIENVPAHRQMLTAIRDKGDPLPDWARG